MFEAAAAKIATAVQERRKRDRSAPTLWEQIRRLCKEVIVFLESCEQSVLAARVERECDALKEAWLAPEGGDACHDRSFRVADSAEELCATLTALARFQQHLSRLSDQEGTPDRGGKTAASVFKHAPWPGSDQWENWGIGLADDGTWRLYHFHRRNGCWIPHHHAALAIPAGISDSLARKFIRFGFIRVPDAHAVLRKLAKAAVGEQIRESEVIGRIKSPMSRLRRAICQAVAGEVHQPKGRPISSPTKHGKNWQARVRFGTVEKRDRGGLQFKVHY